MLTRPVWVVEAAARLPTAQLIFLPPVTLLTVQLVGPGVTATLVTVNEPLDRLVSSITTLRASDGPWLSTKTVQFTGVPASTVVSGLQSLETCRSAESLINAVSKA